MVPFSASVTVMIGEKSEEESDDDGGDKVTEGREVEFLVMRVMIGGNDLRKRKKNSPRTWEGKKKSCNRGEESKWNVHSKEEDVSSKKKKKEDVVLIL